ncbi:MAG: 30S ribosome-binding factor RbfA [Bacteroidetes bacterium]|nr:30S ribosome-binding factor RbfA [Bacteroidota bacterium]
MSHRTQKVASLIKQEIGKLFTNEFADLSPNMITVTQVRMSDDLSVAKVFLSVWGRIEDVDLTFIRLEERKKDIRYELAKSIKNHFRVIPELIFRKDDSQEYSQKIEALFKKIHEEEQNRHS